MQMIISIITMTNYQCIINYQLDKVAPVCLKMKHIKLSFWFLYELACHQISFKSMYNFVIDNIEYNLWQNILA